MSSPENTLRATASQADIALIMGSNSDWPTLSETAKLLDQFEASYSAQIISAHRTPDRLYQFAKTAEKKEIKVIIAGAGGAAHLPGMIASLTPLPVLGVPVRSETLQGLDSLLSIVQMPAGIPVASFAIGKAGAKNAALAAISILALSNKALANRLKHWRKEQTESVAETPFHTSSSPETS